MGMSHAPTRMVVQTCFHAIHEPSAHDFEMRLLEELGSSEKQKRPFGISATTLYSARLIELSCHESQPIGSKQVNCMPSGILTSMLGLGFLAHCSWTSHGLLSRLFAYSR